MIVASQLSALQLRVQYNEILVKQTVVRPAPEPTKNCTSTECCTRTVLQVSSEVLGLQTADQLKPCLEPRYTDEREFNSGST